MSQEKSEFNYIAHSEDEIDLGALFKVLWAGKYIVMATTVVASAITVYFALQMPDIYRSTALLAPVSNSNSATDLSKKLGGLATLAGVSVSNGIVDKTSLGIEVLKSRRFFQQFSEKHDILVSLMASKGWNRSNNRIEIDNEIYDEETKSWVRKVKPPFGSKPSLLEAHEQFLKLLSVSQDKKTGFVSVSIEHFSPNIARQWVNWLVADINETIREQDVSQAEKSIEYLKKQISQTPLTELQAGFFDLIQSQTETIMLAKASPEYLFKTIDPAVAPELKFKPKRSVICIFGAFIGVVLGMLIVFVTNYVRNNSKYLGRL